MATTSTSMRDGARRETIRRRIVTRAVTGVLVSASTAALLIGSAAAPADARPWPDDPNRGDVVVAAVPVSRPGAPAPLRRVGTQFVRADDLTGAGAPAPAWIPELQRLG